MRRREPHLPYKNNKTVCSLEQIGLAWPVMDNKKPQFWVLQHFQLVRALFLAWHRLNAVHEHSKRRHRPVSQLGRIRNLFATKLGAIHVLPTCLSGQFDSEQHADMTVLDGGFLVCVQA